MADNSSMNCAALLVRDKFSDYIQTLNINTNGNFSLLEECKPELCNALWGSGNPDISGIGMTIGYFLENILAFLLVVAPFLIRRLLNHQSSKPALLALSKVNDSFYFCASFLTFSIQIAVIVVMSRANFGISTVDMGSYTMRITWAVSLLSLLPLLYGAFMDDIFKALESTSTSQDGLSDSPNVDDVKSRERHFLHFPLYLVCFFFSTYTFVISMDSSFGSSQIGNGPGSVVSTSDWAIIELICYADVTLITTAEDTAMKFFLVVTWILIYVLTMGKLVVVISEKLGKRLPIVNFLTRKSGPNRRSCSPVRLFSLFPWRTWPAWVTPILAVGQSWTYLRLLKVQREMSQASDNISPGSEWSFGQIVAVTVFAPVLAEGLSQIWTGFEHARAAEPVASSSSSTQTSEEVGVA